MANTRETAKGKWRGILIQAGHRAKLSDRQAWPLPDVRRKRPLSL